MRRRKSNDAHHAKLDNANSGRSLARRSLRKLRGFVRGEGPGKLRSEGGDHRKRAQRVMRREDERQRNKRHEALIKLSSRGTHSGCYCQLDVRNSAGEARTKIETCA